MYWSQLSEQLIQRGHQVMIVSGTPRKGQFASPNTVGLLPVGSNLRSRSIATLLNRYLFRRRYSPKVLAVAQEWNPDIIHTVPPIASEAALRSGKKLDVPVIASVLSHVEEQWTHLEPGLIRPRLFRVLESRALQGAFTRIICLTHRSKRVLAAEGVSTKRMVYVPHAVDVTRFHSDVSPQFRYQLELSEESMVIGYAGALTHDKGFDQLLGALRRLKSVQDLHLLVAGDISVRTEWMALCNEAGLTNVHFLGQLDHQDMPAFMVSLDLLVIPSYTETLPTTLLEALASGTPVMATAVGGVTEFLRSKWGITLPSPEMDLIVDAVNYWRKHRTELEQMGRDGQRYVREHHSWERASALTEGVYQSCLETQ